MRSLLPIFAALAVIACGQSATAPKGAAPAAKTEFLMPVDPPAFVGGWATVEEDCADPPWRFTADGVTTRGEIACTFTDVQARRDGYLVSASCTAEAPPAPYAMTFEFPEEAGGRRLHVEGAPWAAKDLLSCAL